jgi:hypothetical protein
MPVQKSIPSQRIIGGVLIETSEISFVSEQLYTTNGESLIIVKDVENCQIILDSSKTDHVTIKSLTNTKISPLVGLIDEEYSEVNIKKGACIEIYFSFGNWYIVSSDGIKSE